MSETPTCATCRHWLPKETPRWAARMQMAVCALKNTKAVTLSHRFTCSKHQPAAQRVIDARAVWLRSVNPVPTHSDHMQ